MPDHPTKMDQITSAVLNYGLPKEMFHIGETDKLMKENS